MYNAPLLDVQKSLLFFCAQLRRLYSIFLSWGVKMAIEIITILGSMSIVSGGQLEQRASLGLLLPFFLFSANSLTLPQHPPKQRSEHQNNRNARDAHHLDRISKPSAVKYDRAYHASCKSRE